jgi:hypothetical protein
MSEEAKQYLKDIGSPTGLHLVHSEKMARIMAAFLEKQEKAVANKTYPHTETPEWDQNDPLKDDTYSPYVLAEGSGIGFAVIKYDYQGEYWIYADRDENIVSDLAEFEWMYKPKEFGL